MGVQGDRRLPGRRLPAAERHQGGRHQRVRRRRDADRARGPQARAAFALLRPGHPRDAADGGAYPALIRGIEGFRVRLEADEVIVSTLPERVSRWLHLDLGHRIELLGVPVSVVTAEQAECTLSPGDGSG